MSSNSAQNNNYTAPEPKFTPEELRRVVTAPIPASALREHFMNKDVLFVIDYKNSTLKGMKLLTYLANLKMPVDIQWDLDNYAEYSELLSAYFNQRGVVDCLSLASLASEVVMFFSGTTREERVFNSPVSDEFIRRFCEDNLNEIAMWCAFLSSMVVYIGRRVRPGLITDTSDIVEIEAPDAIGHNVVNLLTLPGFLSNFLEKNKTPYYGYFKHQFEDRMFGGYSLAYYFMCPSNTILPFLSNDSLNAMELERQEFLEQLRQHHPEEKENKS